MTGIIYINGIIGKDYKLQDALIDMQKHKIADNIILKIGSNGGFVDIADEIYKVFKASGKIIQTENIGNIASAAVKLFMLAPKENRIFDPTKGVFLIHNPIGEEITGDANFFELISKELGKVENELINFYANETGTDKNVIAGFMQINEPLTTEQIELLGFAKIQTMAFQAVAYFNINNQNQNEMTETKLEGILSKFDALFTSIGKKFGFKNLLIADAAGTNLDFGTQIETPEQLAVGMTAKYEDGTTPVGDVVLPDGMILVFDEAGTITEIKMPEEEQTIEVEVEALKNEIEALKAENENLKQSQSTAKAEFEAAVKNIKAEMKSELISLVEEAPENKENEPKNRFAKK